MMVRRVAIALAVVMAFIGGMVWQRQFAGPPGARQDPGAAGPGTSAIPPEAQIAEPTADRDPGLAWTVPKRWATLGDRPMRVATYSAPAAGGDAEAAECAVFYFGPSEGGGVEDNIARWIDQFENARSPRRATRTVNGFKVHRVQVSGDYLAPSGPMMQSTGTKKGYMLIGAIVEGPAGGVFFKLTGPENTVNAASSEFDAMVESIRAG